MEWAHPDIGLDELLLCVQAFVDILVLTFGYQSSGHSAHWDPENIKKALQWAKFFENILEKLPVSEGGKASKQALDMALSELTSDPLFPQGLAWISAATLAESRKRILGSLLGALDLRDGQLTSVLTVACEMDGDGLTDHFKQVLSSDKGYSLAGNELEVKKKRGNPSYIDKQRDNIRQSEVLVLPCSNAFGEKTVGEAANGQGELGKDGLGSESIRHVGSRGTNENSNNRLSDFVIQEITKRHLAVACKASLETGLGVLMDSVTRTKDKRIENEIWEDNLSSASTSRDNNFTRKLELWEQWKINGLLYLLDAKTLSMVSGASLIFNSSKLHWFQVLESLKGPKDKFDDCKIFEIVELCFLGLASKSWCDSIRRFMSVSYQNFSVSKMWHDLQNFLKAKKFHAPVGEETIDLKLSFISSVYG